MNSCVAERTPRLHLSQNRVFPKVPVNGIHLVIDLLSVKDISLLMVLHSGLNTSHLYLKTIGCVGNSRKSPPPDWVDASPFCPGVGEQGIVWAVQVSHLPHLAGDVELDVRVHPTFQERARNAILLPQTVLQGVFAVQGVCLRYRRYRFILFLLGIPWHIPRMKYSTTASSN